MEQQNNRYNTIKIKSIQYSTGPRLIIISQAIGDKRILKFISSGWDLFESLGLRTIYALFNSPVHSKFSQNHWKESDQNNAWYTRSFLADN